MHAISTACMEPHKQEGHTHIQTHIIKHIHHSHDPTIPNNHHFYLHERRHTRTPAPAQKRFIKAERDIFFKKSAANNVVKEATEANSMTRRQKHGLCNPLSHLCVGSVIVPGSCLLTKFFFFFLFFFFL